MPRKGAFRGQNRVSPCLRAWSVSCGGRRQDLRTVILLPESRELNVETDAFDRSILLHELVHHVQAARGRFETMPSACDRWNAAEGEAYALQKRFLAEMRSAKHVAMSGWVARCDQKDSPAEGSIH